MRKLTAASVKKSMSLLTLVMAGLVLGACSSVERNLEVGSTIPAAKGEVEAKKIKNGNTEVDLEVKFLADPEKVRPDATTYVVWLQPQEGTDVDVRNLGALKVSDDLEGELEAVTPYKNFHLFITAESSSVVQSPTGEKLMWTNVAVE